MVGGALPTTRVVAALAALFWVGLSFAGCDDPCCAADADCVDGAVCFEGSCALHCDDAATCNEGEVCVDAAGIGVCRESAVGVAGRCPFVPAGDAR